MSGDTRHQLDRDSTPYVSVVIPHFNDLTALVNCVRLLEKQTYPRTQFEIIVADNNSRCGISEVQATVPTARVITAPIQGAGPARNTGVLASSGAILAFVDSDCAPDPEWLRAGVASLSRFDFSGGTVIATSRDRQRPNAFEAFEMVFAFDFKRYITRVGFTGTGNMFVLREVFDAVGPFRTGLSEDIEWSHRARAKGFLLGHVPEALVLHPARHNWRELRDRWSRMLEEQFALACERRLGRSKWALAAILMPVSIVPHILRPMRSRRLFRLKDRIGAALVLTRLRIWRTGKMLSLLRDREQACKHPDLTRPSSV